MELIEQKFMKSIVIIGCYFGTLRKDTAMFLRSIQANPTIDWLFFSDCDWGKVPDNVKIVNMSFEKLKELVQSHFDFQISLEAPYKLCDFKPAYGDIFKDYAEKYDFWGHCDFDMIFGNLRKFFNEDKLEKYDRIYYQGHLSIYRNIEKICKLYQSDKGPQYYKDVFTTSISCVFDEVDGMYPIFVKENVPIYSEVQCIDVYPYLDVMFHTRREFAISKQFPVNYSKQVFGYEDGGVYKWYMKDGTVEKEEFAYIHFSHKIFDAIDADNYFFTSNGLIPATGKTIPFQNYRKGIDEFRMNFAEFNFRLRRKLKKIKQKRLESRNNR